MSERITPLRRRMIEDMRVRNLSPATQASYVHAVKKFSQYYRRSPEHLGVEDVRTYQVHLVENAIAWATLNQTVSALRFLYGVTLGRKDLPERMPYARKPKTLPVVLSVAEVARLIETVDDLICRTALTTARREHIVSGLPRSLPNTPTRGALEIRLARGSPLGRAHTILGNF